MLKIDEVGDVHNRIDQLVDHFCKGNKAAFGRGADIQSGVLAGIIGGRKNKPSFDVLQKLLTAYPSVNPTWLLFGRGPMLHEGAQLAVESKAPEYATRQQLLDLDKEIATQRQIFEAYKHDLSEVAQLTQTYRISDVNPASKHLADRLGIAKDEARELVLSGQIRAKYIGKDNERARRNSVSYLITEQAVREFLGEA